MAEPCPEHSTASHACHGDLLAWRDVPRTDSAPFVHKFQTNRQKYVYDGNTRRIIRVSPVVWDVIEDFGCKDGRQVIAGHSSRWNGEEITAAMREIAQAQKEQGLFLSNRPRQIRLPGKEMIKKRLDEQREQLILNVTEDCNFRCSYCVYGGGYPEYRAHSARKMSWDVARAAITEFMSHSGGTEGRVISFYGGEPLLNLPLIRRCVAFARQGWSDPAVRFSMTTNGYLLRGRAAEFLADEGFTITISLDGPADIHDRHRRTKGGAPTWAQVAANIRGLLAAHPEYRTNHRLRFAAVATRTTDLGEIQRFLGSCELFADGMGLEVSGQEQPTDKPEPLLPDDPLVLSTKVLRQEFVDGLKSGAFLVEHACRSRWVQTSVFQKAFVTFHKRGFLSPHLPETMVILSPCLPGARRAFVNAGGGYYACERVLECQEGLIGNVHEGVSLDRVMALLDRWIQANHDQCRYCWCLSWCRVGCFANVGEKGVVTRESKQKACSLHRRSMHQLLTEYCDILEENHRAFDYTAALALM